MKKVLVLIMAIMFAFSSLVYAGGDKNHGDKGSNRTQLRPQQWQITQQ